MGLFALHPPDRVTVADIAAAADMTAAAVYYHFPSKEHVLLEGLETFTDRYLAKLRELCRSGGDDDYIPHLVTALLGWLEEVRLSALVYFTHSAGVDAAIEALRRETRIEQVVILARAIRAHTPGVRNDVGFQVAAIALVSLIENASSSLLAQDAVFVGLGRRRFVAETVALAERIISAAGSPSAPRSSG